MIVLQPPLQKKKEEERSREEDRSPDLLNQHMTYSLEAVTQGGVPHVQWAIHWLWDALRLRRIRPARFASDARHWHQILSVSLATHPIRLYPMTLPDSRSLTACRLVMRWSSQDLCPKFLASEAARHLKNKINNKWFVLFFYLGHANY